MAESGYLALFIVGLLGGTHCAGMCGGIVGALSLGGAPRLSLLLAYNAGRIFSYAVAGLLAGLLGAATAGLAGQWPVRLALYLLANLMLVALGFYLLGLTRALAFAEAWGQRLWRHLQPLTARFLPVRSVAQALPLGMLWGWLPCGLVYSALLSAMTSASAQQGALLMLAFGLGTVPNLLLAGLLFARFSHLVRHPRVRQFSGLIVMAFGIHGLVDVLRTMSF